MYPEDFEKWLQHNPTDVDKQTAFRQWVTNDRNFTKAGKPKLPGNTPAKPRKKRERIDYKIYIVSTEWARRSRSFRDLQKTCESCGSSENLQCHHKHYKTLGREKRKDIMVVCYRCHCDLHGVISFE